MQTALMIDATPPRRRPQITQTHADFYRKNGYLVVEDALSPSEVDALRNETVRICRGELGHVSGLPPVLPDESDDEVIQRTLCVHFPHKLSAVMYDFLAQRYFVQGAQFTGLAGR